MEKLEFKRWAQVEMKKGFNDFSVKGVTQDRDQLF